MTGPGRAPSEPSPTPTLRVSAAATAVAGLVAVSVAGLLSWPTTVLVVLVVAVSAAAPVRYPSAKGVATRRLLATAVISFALVAAVLTSGAGHADGMTELAGSLGPWIAAVLPMVLIGQLLISDRVREVMVSLVIAGAMFVLALANHPPPAVGLPVLLGWPAAVIALVSAHDARSRARADVVATTGAPGLATEARRHAAYVALSMLVAVLLVLVVPHPQGIQPRGARGDTTGTDSGGPADGRTGRSTQAYTTGVLDMRARGTLPDVEVADVPAASPTLWRGAVLTRYDGVSWRATPDRTVGQQLAGGPPFALSDTDPPVAHWAQSRDEVTVRAGFTGVLLAPGGPTSVDVAGRLLHLAGGWFLGGDDAGYPATYQVVSQRTDLPADRLRSTPVAATVAADQAPVDSLLLPDTVPDRVRGLGRSLAANASDRYGAVRAVEDYLRSHATYRLDSPVPPPGADAVDHFLFVARTGFCEQFAAAEVVLLRSAGVPARMATGFAEGRVDGSTRTLRGSDAHAWVEVWYPGVGWAASDPTAGSTLAGDGWAHRLAAWWQHAGSRLLLAVALLLVTGLGGVSWRLGRAALRSRRRRRGAASGPAQAAGAAAPPPPVLAAFGRLEEALAGVGAARAPTESVRELAARPDLHPVAGALAVVERASYAARLPLGAEADSAVQSLDDLARRLRERAARATRR